MKMYAFNQAVEIVVGLDVVDADEMLRHTRRWNKTAKGWRVVVSIGTKRDGSDAVGLGGRNLFEVAA